MNKIIVEVSIGELLDKISILEIKQEKIKDPEKLRFISNEHSILKKQLDDNVKSDDKIKDLFQSLKKLKNIQIIKQFNGSAFFKRRIFTEKN